MTDTELNYVNIATGKMTIGDRDMGSGLTSNLQTLNIRGITYTSDAAPLGITIVANHATGYVNFETTASTFANALDISTVTMTSAVDVTCKALTTVATKNGGS